MGDNPDWNKLFESLGKDFHICRMTFKNHSCCGHTFAAIDGALALKTKMGIAAGDIERVTVGTYQAALDVAGCEQPRTPAEARFSLKYVVATALTHGNVRLAAFEPARMEDGVTRSFMQKISVSVDKELDAAFPHQRAARVAFVARDGRQEEFLQPTRVGDPDAPLSDAQLEEKYLELAVPVIGRDRAEKLLERLWKLEQLKAIPE
jgi:2-methylcitrate dehydratase PrpD